MWVQVHSDIRKNLKRFVIFMLSIKAHASHVIQFDVDRTLFIVRLLFTIREVLQSHMILPKIEIVFP